jgi:hypothetical protein
MNTCAYCGNEINPQLDMFKRLTLLTGEGVVYLHKNCVESWEYFRNMNYRNNLFRAMEDYKGHVFMTSSGWLSYVQAVYLTYHDAAMGYWPQFNNVHMLYEDVIDYLIYQPDRPNLDY